jgi:histidinol dehydrogenase
MMRIQDLRGTTPSTADLLDLLPRPVTDVAVALDVARELVEDVRTRGSAALLDQAERLDRVRPESLRVPAEAIAAAVDALDPAVRAALEEAIRRVRLGSAAQVPPETTTTVVPGGTIVQRWQPVRRAASTCPAARPSTRRAS